MLKGVRYNTFENLIYLSLPTGILLLALGGAYEQQCRPLRHIYEHVLLHVANNAAALVANMAAYFA